MTTRPIIVAATMAAFLALGAYTPTIAAVSVSPVVKAETVEHGGGCRKSSPAGMCCHKEHATGIVHCH